ncbi:MAG TPA: SDR family oxidoreductase [Gemmatimonadota bacterium]|jgi:uncharacterized protein YbjT (DUF2867 family)
MRLLIIGATGGTGRQLVAQALDRGHRVTAFARSPWKIKERHPRLTVVQGDVLDRLSVEAAVRDQDAVLCALGHRRWFYPNVILSTGTWNILGAMDGNGVRRFICLTSLGVGDSFARLGLLHTLFVIPFVLPFYFWDKERQEEIIRESDLDWVIVRPGVLTDDPPRGGYHHGPRAGHWLWTPRISRADVADFMLNQLSNNTYLRESPGICW